MKEVQVAAKLGPAGEVGEAADGDRARVAGEDGVFRRVLAEVFEDALLGVEILDHRLDDNIRIAHALADAAGILDPRDGLLGLVLRQPALLDGAIDEPAVLSSRAFELTGNRVDQGHVVAAAWRG